MIMYSETKLTFTFKTATAAIEAKKIASETLLTMKQIFSFRNAAELTRIPQPDRSAEHRIICKRAYTMRRTVRIQDKTLPLFQFTFILLLHFSCKICKG